MCNHKFVENTWSINTYTFEMLLRNWQLYSFLFFHKASILRKTFSIYEHTALLRVQEFLDRSNWHFLFLSMFILYRKRFSVSNFAIDFRTVKERKDVHAHIHACVTVITIEICVNDNLSCFDCSKKIALLILSNHQFVCFYILCVRSRNH